MGPVRLGVGTEWMLDGQAFGVRWLDTAFFLFAAQPTCSFHPRSAACTGQDRSPQKAASPQRKAVSSHRTPKARPSSGHSVSTPGRTITAKRLQTKAQGRAAHPGLRDHHRANPNGISQFARPVTFLVWNPVGVRRDLGHSLPRVALRGFAAALTLDFGLQRLRRKVTK